MFNSIGWMEIMLVGAVALLIYGRELPEVAREAGRVIGQFKRSLRGVELDFHRQIDLSIEQEEHRRLKSAAMETHPVTPAPLEGTRPPSALPPDSGGSAT